MSESPHEPDPVTTNGAPLAFLVDAAREIAAALCLAGPKHQRHLLVTLARTLRESLAREGTGSPKVAAGPAALRCAQAIAHAIGVIPSTEEPAIVIADLRFFARLTLGECAELLDSPRDLLRRVWRTTRHIVFTNARADLAAQAVDPPSSDK